MAVRTPRRGAALWAPVLATALATTAACATGGSDGGSAPGSGAAPAVDPASLDTGDLPTHPAPPFGRATDDDVLEVDAQRMAEFVVAPYQVDPTLAGAASSLSVMKSPDRLASLMSDDAARAAADNRMLYGYSTWSVRPTTDSREPTHQLWNVVLRFPTPEEADRAGRALHDVAARKDRTSTPAASEIPGLDPAARIVRRPARTTQGEELATQAFTVRGDYLLVQWVQAAPAEQEWSDRTLAGALRQQSELIDRFPRTPTRTQNGGAPPEYPQIDQHRVLVYAIPFADGDAAGGDDAAVYGPQGMTHHAPNPALAQRLPTETGSVHNAVARTTVYRPRDEDGARRVVDGFAGDPAARGYAPSPSPKGLPDARCLARDAERGHEEYCYVRVGRYVGETAATDKREVDQLTSAQYLILTEADQNA